MERRFIELKQTEYDFLDSNLPIESILLHPLYSEVLRNAGMDSIKKFIKLIGPILDWCLGNKYMHCENGILIMKMAMKLFETNNIRLKTGVLFSSTFRTKMESFIMQTDRSDMRLCCNFALMIEAMAVITKGDFLMDVHGLIDFLSSNISNSEYSRLFLSLFRDYPDHFLKMKELYPKLLDSMGLYPNLYSIQTIRWIVCHHQYVRQLYHSERYLLQILNSLIDPQRDNITKIYILRLLNSIFDYDCVISIDSLQKFQEFLSNNSQTLYFAYSLRFVRPSLQSLIPMILDINIHSEIKREIIDYIMSQPIERFMDSFNLGLLDLLCDQFNRDKCSYVLLVVLKLINNNICLLDDDKREKFIHEFSPILEKYKESEKFSCL